jgi:thiol:disulfide interchange protein DsbA
MTLRRLLLPIATVFAAMLPLACSAQPEAFVEGTHYRELRSPEEPKDLDKVEVAEIFWYGCPHCFTFEPHIERWKENKPADVVFTRLPTALGRPEGVIHMKAYYTAEALNVTDLIHPAIFRAMHNERRNINSEQAVAGLFERAGVSNEDFAKTFNGFAIDSRVRVADQRIRDFGINSVPMVVVDGRWQTGPSMAGGYDEAIQVINFLIAKARNSR